MNARRFIALLLWAVAVVFLAHATTPRPTPPCTVAELLSRLPQPRFHAVEDDGVWRITELPAPLDLGDGVAFARDTPDGPDLTGDPAVVRDVRRALGR